MSIGSLQDVLYLVAAICLAWVTVFLCWGLYEIARLVHQINSVTWDAREKLSRLERLASNLSERIGSASSYLGVLAEGGKQVMSMMKKRGEDDDDEEIFINKKAKRNKKKSADWE